jgi:hypothetical protein
MDGQKYEFPVICVFPGLSLVQAYNITPIVDLDFLDFERFVLRICPLDFMISSYIAKNFLADLSYFAQTHSEYIRKKHSGDSRNSIMT